MIKEYGYEYDAVLNDAVFEKTHWRTTNKKLDGALCLRSGRDALKWLLVSISQQQFICQHCPVIQ